MNSTFSVILFSIEELIKESPALFAELKDLFSSGDDITLEQIQAKRAAIANQKFTDIVPNSELPEDQPTPPAGPS